MRLRPLLAPLLCLTLLGAPSPGRAEDPVAAARLEQETLPALAARAQAARARGSDAQRFFAGDVPFERAFPALVDAPLHDPGALRLAAERARSRAIQRAGERLQQPPEGVDAARWRGAVEAACGAEDAADALELQLYSGLSAGLSLAPGLAAPSLDRRLAALDAAARVEDGASAEALEAAATAQDEARALRAWRRAALIKMARPADTALDALAAEALAAWAAAPTPTAEGALGLQDRLIRALPLLSAGPRAEAEAVIAAIDDAYVSPQLQALSAPPERPERPRAVPELEAALRAATQRLGQAEDAAQAVTADPASSPGARAVAEAHKDAAAALHAALSAELDAARALDAAGGAIEGASVDALDRLAQEARDRAEGANSAAEAALRARTVALRERVAAETRDEASRRAAAAAALAEQRARREAASASLREAAALASLDPDRARRIDAAYIEARALTTALQQLAEDAADRARALRAARPEEAQDEAQEGSEALAELAAAQADLRAAALGRQRAAEAEQDAAVRLLIEARALRREGRALASGAARRKGQQAFIPELAEELRTTWIVAESRLRAVVSGLFGLPALATDLTALLGLIVGSIELLIGGLLWLVLRRRLPGIVEAELLAIEAAEPLAEGVRPTLLRLARAGLTPGPLPALAAPLAAPLTAAVDLCAAAAALSFLGGRLPALSLVVTVLAARAATRGLPGLTDAALASADAEHPALRVVSEETIRRVRRWVTALVSWRALTAVALAVAWELLAADRAAQGVGALSVAAGILLCVMFLASWSDELRAAAAADMSPTALTRLAARPVQGWAKVPQAALGVVALTLDTVWQGGTELLASRAQLRWVTAALARRQLGARGVEGEALSAEQQDALANAPSDAPPNVRQAVARVFAERDDWRRTHRRGAVVIVGDRGAGLDRLPELLAEGAPNLLVLRPPRRISDAKGARAWLAESLGAESSEPQALCSAAISRSEELIVVMDLHLLMLRGVGGFAALGALLDVIQRGAEERLWVCAARTPLWRYLEGAPGAVDLGVFRAPIELGALRADALESWLLGAEVAAGFVPSFTRLAAVGGVSDARGEARARAAWARLIEDLSQGAPEVARALWLHSLRAGASPEQLEHGPPRLDGLDALDQLSTEDLFLLTALAIHGPMTLSALIEALNRPESALRAACRRLEALGVLMGELSGELYELHPRLHPQILRVLRQRALLETA